MRRHGVNLGAFRVVIVAAASVLAVPSFPVYANDSSDIQNSDNEVLLGAVDVPAPGARQGQNPEPQANQNPAPPPQPERGPAVAAQLYARATEALEAGERVSAQRLFEKVIAADPRGPRAADARAHLGQLYTGTPAANAQAWAGAPDAPDRDEEDRNALSGGAPASSGASVEERFVTEAGDRVFFSAGSSELGGRARAVLAAQADWLNKRPEWNITIEAHADDPPLNLKDMEMLSQARARAVRERLVAEGVAASRIAVVAVGRQAPISDCAEAGCQAQNRRVISVLTPRLGFSQRNLRQHGQITGPASSAPLTASRDGDNDR